MSTSTPKPKLYKETCVPAVDLPVFLQIAHARRATGTLSISLESGSPRGMLVWRELVQEPTPKESCDNFVDTDERMHAIVEVRA